VHPVPDDASTAVAKGGIAAEFLLKAHRIFALQLTDLPPGMMIRFGEIGLTSVLRMWRGL
jgi:hypothetical protein